VRVPAKVNLHLGVGPRRGDGKHELHTIYHAVSLFGLVTVERAERKGVTVEIEGEHVGVRVDDPGAHAHFPRGDTVWDLARAWTPCW